jgi:hypothetical protein
VREVEQHGPVQLTRRGKLVAIVLSPDEYERLTRGKIDLWDAYLAFRKRIDLEGIDLDVDEIFADVRDRSAPAEPRW